MGNELGANQFQREKPYGQVKKMTQLTKAAPMSGAPTPALTTPQRSQRRAINRGTHTTPRGQQAPVTVPPPPGPAPYQAQLASIWADIAAEIPDPLVAEYAARASGRA